MTLTETTPVVVARYLIIMYAAATAPVLGAWAVYSAGASEPVAGIAFVLIAFAVILYIEEGR